MGLKVVELVGMGPAPYAAMLLADLGADVVRVDRVEPARARADQTRHDPAAEIVNRGRRSAAVDLKKASGLALVLDLIGEADVLLEPYRPGVAEKLGIGPEPCFARRPQLVYARMTGWGQTGPLAGHAGHDINFVALAGALAHIGRAGQPPVPPLNLVGDMGGGGMFLAFGVVCAVLEARVSGQGQVVDVAMLDGVASMMTMVYGYQAQGHYSMARGHNAIDSGAPFYEVYECADGKYVSIGPIEFRFYANLLKAIGLSVEDLPPRRDREQWPAAKDRLAEEFRRRSRDEWCRLLEGEPDICFAPVLDLLEAPRHHHHVSRGTFVTEEGVLQPAPAPRFSRTPGAIQRPPARPGEHTAEVLSDWLRLDRSTIATLAAAGVVTGPPSAS
ncbi:MAG: CaiB/BaiF CoA transferase family protein [Mycobacteriales bacterium]